LYSEGIWGDLMIFTFPQYGVLWYVADKKMRLRTSGSRVTGEGPVMFKAEIRTYLLATKLWTPPLATKLWTPP
jgi:hypothetical protein